MTFATLLNMAVVLFMVALLLEQMTTRVEACKCLPAGLYEGFHDADVVLHALVLNRYEQADMFDDVTYTLDTITVYKEDPNVTLSQEVGFITRGNSFICGVELDLDEEYLIGLYRTDGYNNLTASYCGLAWEWSWLTDEDKASLENGFEDDPCDESCGSFQECLYHAFGSPGVYYCADACAPTPCAYGEVCALVDVACLHDPCPPIANCTLSDELNQR